MVASRAAGCAVAVDTGAVVAPEALESRSGLDANLRLGVYLPGDSDPWGLGVLPGVRARVAPTWQQLSATLTLVVLYALTSDKALVMSLAGGVAAGRNRLAERQDTLADVSPSAELALMWSPTSPRDTHLTLTLATEWAGRYDGYEPCSDESLITLRVGVLHQFWPF